MKVIKIVSFALPLIAASNAFAGDAENAANAGYTAPLPLAIIAGLAMLAGLVVFIYKHFKASRKPVVTATTVIATVMGLHAGDFANAADAGFGLDRRSRLLGNGIDAAGRVTLQQWLDAGSAMSRSNDGIGVMLDSLRDATRDYVSPVDAGIVYKSPTSNTGSPLHGSDVDACSTGQ